MREATGKELSPVVRRFIEEIGGATQLLGAGRVVGRIYAYLYFSPRPRSLADLQSALGISKGSASMGVRQLEQWGGARKIWVKGDRRDYYEADEWLGRFVKSALMDTIGQKLAAYTAFLDSMDRSLTDGDPSNGEKAFVAERIQRLKRFNERAHRIWTSAPLRILLER